MGRVRYIYYILKKIHIYLSVVCQILYYVKKISLHICRCFIKLPECICPNYFVNTIDSTDTGIFLLIPRGLPLRQSFLIHAVRKSLRAARKMPAKLNIDSQQRQCLIWLKILARNTVVCKWLICQYAWVELWFPIVDLGCKIPMLWQKTTILSVIT